LKLHVTSKTIIRDAIFWNISTFISFPLNPLKMKIKSASGISPCTCASIPFSVYSSRSLLILLSFLISLPLLITSTITVSGQEVLTASDLLQLKSLNGTQLSPDGKEVIYYISTPRGPNENPGPAKSTYYRMILSGGRPEPLFEGGVKGSSPMWSPDGKHIAFLYGRGDEPKQVWAMPSSGRGQARLTDSESGVSSFRWQPGRRGIAYLASTPLTPREKELDKRGYGLIWKF